LEVPIEDITCILAPQEELGGLYLGSYSGALNSELIKKYRIRAVLTASFETKIKY
jgi:hypothetical protein